MSTLYVELRSLVLICATLEDEIKSFSPQHPALWFQGNLDSEEARHKRLMRFYITFGPKEMNRNNPTVEDQVSCYYEYRAHLSAVIVLEKVKVWGKLS